MCQPPCPTLRPSAPTTGRLRGGGRTKAVDVETHGCVWETKSARVQEAGLGELPVDCIAAVLSKCSPRDVCRLSCVSRAWSQAGNTEEAWASSLPQRCRESLPAHFPGVHPGATPRETARALSKGILSRDGAFFLALHPSTGRLRVHVSAARALAGRPGSEDGRLVWRQLGGVPGAVFDPCALLVTSRGMRAQWDILPPFTLPLGTFSVSWRVGSQGGHEGEGPSSDPAQRFCHLTGPSACLQASLLTQSPHSPHSPQSPEASHSQERPHERPRLPLLPSPSGAAALSPEVQVLDLSKVVGEPEAETQGGGWDEEQARRAAEGWRAIAPCGLHSGGVRSGTGAGPGAGSGEGAEASESRGTGQTQGRAGPTTTPSHFQAQLLSQSPISEGMRRRLGSLWPFARCTCHEAVALQQQHLALLRQISQVETMQWEYLKLGTVQHKPPALPAADGSSPAGDAESRREKGSGGRSDLGGFQFSLLLEEHESNRGKSKLHVDGIVLTLQ